MTTPAEGCLSKAEERLQNMLAACKPLQTWMGVNDAAAAKARIYLVELPPPITDDDKADGNFSLAELQSRRPFCQVWTPADQPFTLDIIASPATPNMSGVLRVRLEENVPAEDEHNYPEAYRKFLNTIGKILHSSENHNPGLVELLKTCQPDHLAFSRIDVLDHMRTSSDDLPTLGDAHKCELEIKWGATF